VIRRKDVRQKDGSRSFRRKKEMSDHHHYCPRCHCSFDCDRDDCMENDLCLECELSERDATIASMQHEALMRERELDNRLFYTRRKLDEAYDTIRCLIRRTGSTHCTRDELVEILAFARVVAADDLDLSHELTAWVLRRDYEQKFPENRD